MARHDESGTYVAVEYLTAARLGGDVLACFRAEAHTLATRDDPNVARRCEYVESADGGSRRGRASLSH